jgi:hypothetical protein
MNAKLGHVAWTGTIQSRLQRADYFKNEEKTGGEKFSPQRSKLAKILKIARSQKSAKREHNATHINLERIIIIIIIIMQPW